MTRVYEQTIPGFCNWLFTRNRQPIRIESSNFFLMVYESMVGASTRHARIPVSRLDG